MTPQQFAKKWAASTLKERSAAQEHFIDLCRLLGEQTPADADPEGTWYCFERGAKKTGGGEGWADVWRRGCFAWEYKGKHKDLTIAFTQLQRYAIALENPPLLVVSDMDSIVIHTNFTNTVEEIHVIPIADIAAGGNLQKLKWLFSEPERLRPGITTAAITEKAASKFASLAEILRSRGYEPQKVAHFLNKMLFCLFAEDAGLLPSRLFVRLLEAGQKHPEKANEMLRSLFGAMTKGGLFGADLIEWFNGGLFDTDEIIPLQPDEIAHVLSVARLDWSSIEPSVFGTLFERGLDPSKRSQLGAHYTDPESIMRIVQPVVIDPLAAEWAKIKTRIESALEKSANAKSASAKTMAHRHALADYTGYLHRLAEFRILDPACGSGNFLYLALQALKGLEHRVMLEAEQLGLERGFVGMNVGVQCVRGIEINNYAAELARVTVWIGEIQWMLRHGVPPSKNPILKPLETIECRDAVLNDDGSEPIWPEVNAIIGNPPFLGSFRMRGELGDDYTELLRQTYSGRVEGGADLVCYWFEKAREATLRNPSTKVGLVATNSIRQPTNRKILDRILEHAVIRTAWSDEPWVNEGAAVRVSLICFDTEKSDRRAVLNGEAVQEIYTDLSSPTTAGGSLDLTKAKPLSTNRGWSYFGFALAGPFTVSAAQVVAWLRSPNANGRSNSDVLRLLWNGSDLTGRWDERWVIDFAEMSEAEAALYEAPFEYVLTTVKPVRDTNRRAARAKYWWRYGEVRPGLRKSLQGVVRYIATSEKSKHRFFVWLPVAVAPDNRLIVFPKDDEGLFGILSSRIHVCWALAVGSTLEDRPAYATTTCFDKFPFPSGMTPNLDAAKYTNPHAGEVGVAAQKLDKQRERWLNPPEWSNRVPSPVPSYPASIVAIPGHEQDLNKRTLTNLYNVYPSWLASIHRELDEAVARAYGWKDYEPTMPDEEILSRLLKLNLERSTII